MSILSNLRLAFSLVPPGRRRRWLTLAVVMAASAAAEAACAVAIFALVALIGLGREAVAGEPNVGLATWWPFDWPGGEVSVQVAIAVVAGLFVLKTLLAVLALVLDHRVLIGDRAAAACRLYAGYLWAPYSYHLEHSTADGVHGILTRIEYAFEDTLRQGLRLANAALTSTAILVVLFAAAPALTLATASVLAAVVTLVLLATKRWTIAVGARLDQLGARRLFSLWEGLRAIEEIKALGREGHFVASFESLQRSLLRSRYLGGALASLPRVLIEVGFILTVLGAAAFLLRPGLGATHLLPVLGLYAYAGLRLLPMAIGSAEAIHRIQGASEPLRLLCRDHALLDGYARTQREVGPAAELSLRSRLTLEGVSFHYPGCSEAALRDLDLEIPRGQSLGIVGPTGAGKSTLIRLLLALVEPTEGSIRVDDVDLSRDASSWRQRIGYVPQDVLLVDDSLRRNVAFGIPDAEIDEERVREVLALAHLDGFVAGLPDGLSTSVGERGVRLSGGQRQRVAIARALYSYPEILLLDEATSALDRRTEAAVLRSIDALHGSLTTIVVSHRLSTVRRCDRLAVLEEGTLIDVGSFAELLDRVGMFRELVEPAELVLFESSSSWPSSS